MQHLQFSVCLFIETTMSVFQCFCDVYELLDSGFKVERTPKTAWNYFISNQTTLRSLTRLSKTLITSDSADCAMYYCVHEDIVRFCCLFLQNWSFLCRNVHSTLLKLPQRSADNKTHLVRNKFSRLHISKKSWKSNLHTYGFLRVHLAKNQQFMLDSCCQRDKVKLTMRKTIHATRTLYSD